MSIPHSTPISWFHQTWPKPANIRAATILFEDTQKLWSQKDKKPNLLQQEKIIELIHAIGGNSPYLSDLILKDIDFFEYILENNPDIACETTFNTLRNFSIQESRQSVARIIRITKQKIALSCALADIGNIWSLSQITATISLLAESTLNLVVNHLLLQAHSEKKLTLLNPEHPSQNSGFIILGMGKLGAKELNYSSDIDLIILYDPDIYPNHEDLKTVFIRITRQLVSLMEERDEHGYVFRTDLRLRPDPSSSPLAVSLPAAITYYESLGQTWERSAMSKARPVAGDIQAGYDFLDAIRPFIWRRHLDFTVIDDIHGIKSRIDHHKNIGKNNLSSLSTETSDEDALSWLVGQNVKLGHGGIREIEFCPQTMQLVWAGRFPELRDSTTIGGIKKLVNKDLLPKDQSEILIEAYYLLRQTEHRLQMQNDYQTHSLPNSLEELKEFSIFMGYSTPEAFAHTLFPLMQKVRRIFENLFAAPENDDDYILDLSTDELISYLNKKGFPNAAADILQSWNASGPRALRTSRARSILKNVLPKLLDAFADQRNPLLILQRFDTLLARHRAGIQLLSLFERNPTLIQRLAFIIGSSPFIAEYISSNPAALDALLEVNINKTKINLYKTIRNHLQTANSFQDVLLTLHNIVRGEEFRLSVARLENRIDVNKTHVLRTFIANTIMKALLEKVTQEHEQKYGIIPDGGISIIVLGKAGSWEMTSESDLDLMLIFDHPPEIYESIIPETSTHHLPSNIKPRTLSTNNYYIRLTQTFIAALTNPGSAGSLYEVDMRLRPSGSKGPVAVSLSSFERYHKEEAWTWERMALTRARVIGGPLTLRKKLKSIIDFTLSAHPRNQTDQTILQDVINMRKRLIKDAPPSGPWDIKHLPGGLMELEFIAQTLQLTAHNPLARHTCTRIALKRLAEHHYLTIEESNILIEADHFWRSLQSLLRIFFGKHPPNQLEQELTPIIIEVMKQNLLENDVPIANSFHLIQQKMRQVSQNTRDLFTKLIGPLS